MKLKQELAQARKENEELRTLSGQTVKDLYGNMLVKEHHAGFLEAVTILENWSRGAHENMERMKALREFLKQMKECLK